MTDTFNLVGEFHRKFDLPVAESTPPGFPDESTICFRIKFLMEELSELVLACGYSNAADAISRAQDYLNEYPDDGKDLEKAADALADLKYVTDGTAHMLGIPLNEVFAEVQRANMSKERAVSAGDPRSTRGHSLDVVKPKDFVPPNHAPILEQHAKRFRIGE
jgi:predicted HAD superfamily Cof-like phosphohydrolase